MSAAMFWVVSPTCEISNGVGFLDALKESNRVVDSLRSRSLVGCDRLNRGFRSRGNCGSLNVDLRFSCFAVFNSKNQGRVLPISSVATSPTGEIALSSEQKVYEVVLKQAALVKRHSASGQDMEVKPEIALPATLSLLNEAYNRCGEVCAEYAKTFYLG